MFYSVIETWDFSLFNQSAQALLKGYFIKSYRNTCASLGELEITWKHSHYVLVFPLIISRSPKLARVFL